MTDNADKHHSVDLAECDNGTKGFSGDVTPPLFPPFSLCLSWPLCPLGDELMARCACAAYVYDGWRPA